MRKKKDFVGRNHQAIYLAHVTSRYHIQSRVLLVHIYERSKLTMQHYSPVFEYF